MRGMRGLGMAALALAAAGLSSRSYWLEDDLVTTYERRKRHPSDGPGYGRQQDAHMDTRTEHRIMWIWQIEHIRAWRRHLKNLEEKRLRAVWGKTEHARKTRLNRRKLLSRGKSRVKGLH